MSTSIVWHRTDLRIEDNLSLLAAVRESECVVPIFVWDPERPTYDAANRLQFMIESLEELCEAYLAQNSRLLIRKGNPAQVLSELVRETGATTVYWGRHYEPYEIARDNKVIATLHESGVRSVVQKESVLFESSEITTKEGKPYTIFTPFKNNILAHLENVAAPTAALKDLKPHARLAELRSDHLDRFKSDKLLLAPQRQKGGGSNALMLWSEFLASGLAQYSERRDLLTVSGTSRISAHLKFGTISIRKIFEDVRRVENAGVYLNEILWREFYSNILQSFPHVAHGAFQKQFGMLEWSDDQQQFEKWRRGVTGFPIVDAAMRELLTTGFMHNRARMIVASFLVKDLRINWQWGEHHFMQHLTDGDLAQNNGGWQWAASTGTDAQPYYRIFNPYLQSKKFDPSGDYIQRHVPELSALPAKLIHEPHLLTPIEQATYGVCLGEDYPMPIVDHAEARLQAIEMFKNAIDKKTGQ